MTAEDLGDVAAALGLVAYVEIFCVLRPRLKRAEQRLERLENPAGPRFPARRR